MGLDIYLFKIEKVSQDFIAKLENFKCITPITSHGVIMPYYLNFYQFESFFISANLEYFDVEKGVKSLGYEIDDISDYTCGLGEDIRIRYLENKNLKLPDALNYLVFDIKVKESRKYELELEYMDRMITNRKPLNTRIRIENVPLYSKNEICLYHTEIGYYRNGMNDIFYNDISTIDTHILSRKQAFSFFEKYADEKHKDIIIKALCEPFIDGETFIRFY
jgi:hypothetical protein